MTDTNNETTKNNWANTATMIVADWFDKDEVLYNMTRQHRNLYMQQGGNGLYEYSMFMKDMIEQIKDDMINIPPCMFSDLLNAALSEVDWRDIARAHFDEKNNG